MNTLELTQFYKTHRENYGDDLRLRIHRALSWLNKADRVAEDELDIKFITLWVSFNAAYARELEVGRSGDRSAFISYLADICRLDKNQAVYRALWSTFSGSIRVLLDNQYTFQPFWDYHNGVLTESAWQEDFAKAKKKAMLALSAKDTHSILITVFDRLYTLRNQILHGGSTYGSSANREQLRDACRILNTLIPDILQIMMENPANAWGKPYYPYLSGK